MKNFDNRIFSIFKKQEGKPKLSGYCMQKACNPCYTDSLEFF